MRRERGAAGGPALLLVYGAYGESLDPGLDASLLPLLARGWTLAFAHVRGGGECGRRRANVHKAISCRESDETLTALRIPDQQREAQTCNQARCSIPRVSVHLSSINDS